MSAPPTPLSVAEHIRLAVAAREANPGPEELLRQLANEVGSLGAKMQRLEEHTPSALKPGRPEVEAPESVVAELHAINERLARMERGTARASKRLLSQRQAAKALGIGRDTLSQLIAAKQVKTSSVNERLRVPLAEVERLARDGFSTETAAPMAYRRKRGRAATSAPCILDFNPRGSGSRK